MLQAMRPLARRKSSGLGPTAKLHARIVEIGWTSCRAAGKWWRAPSGLRRCFGQHWAELVPSIAAQDDRTICRRVLCYSLDRFSRRAMRAKANPRILWLPLKLMELVYSIQAQFLNRVAQGRTTDRSGFSRSVYPPSAAIWARGQRSAAHVGVASPMTIARVPVTVALIYKGHVSNVFHIGFQMMF